MLRIAGLAVLLVVAGVVPCAAEADSPDVYLERDDLDLVVEQLELSEAQEHVLRKHADVYFTALEKLKQELATQLKAVEAEIRRAERGDGAGEDHAPLYRTDPAKFTELTHRMNTFHKQALLRADDLLDNLMASLGEVLTDEQRLRLPDLNRAIRMNSYHRIMPHTMIRVPQVLRLVEEARAAGSELEPIWSEEPNEDRDQQERVAEARRQIEDAIQHYTRRIDELIQSNMAQRRKPVDPNQPVVLRPGTVEYTQHRAKVARRYTSFETVADAAVRRIASSLEAALGPDARRRWEYRVWRDAMPRYVVPLYFHGAVEWLKARRNVSQEQLELVMQLAEDRERVMHERYRDLYNAGRTAKRDNGGIAYGTSRRHRQFIASRIALMETNAEYLRRFRGLLTLSQARQWDRHWRHVLRTTPRDQFILRLDGRLGLNEPDLLARYERACEAFAITEPTDDEIEQIVNEAPADASQD